MKEVYLAVDIDGLGCHQARFECKRQRIVVRIPSGGELTIVGDGSGFVIKMRKYVLRGGASSWHL